MRGSKRERELEERRKGKLEEPTRKGETLWEGKEYKKGREGNEKKEGEESEEIKDVAFF